jgi:uncharacterized membrane protein
MYEVLGAGLFLLITHFGLSSTPLRGALVGVIGERGFQGLYSLVAIGALALLIWTWRESPRLEYAWFSDPSLFWIPKAVMVLAMIFLLGGFLVPNPTQVGGEKILDKGADTRGLLRITRHPFLWSVILWSVSHIVVNGDYVSVCFFGTFLLLGGIGTLLLDHKKAQSLGDKWAPFAAATSNVPFAAVLSGRNRLVPSELWLPTLIGVAGYALVYFLHEWIAGVPVI